MKHLIALIAVAVHRDITATINVQVPEHEILVLQAVHGEDNVYPGAATGRHAALDPDAEFTRLCDKYGQDAVRDAYGAAARGDIRRAVLSGSCGQSDDTIGTIQLEGPDSKVGGQQSQARAEDAPQQQPGADDDAQYGNPTMQWSKAQLHEYAQANGIEVDPDATKAAIFQAIKAPVPA